jgi:hypothetical protein
VPVWLDFEDRMPSTFTMQAGSPNLVVVDAAGRMRMRIKGTLDEAGYARLVQTIEGLRREAAAATPRAQQPER